MNVWTHLTATFDFDNGTLLLTEAGSKRQASLYLVRGEAALAEHDPGEDRTFARANIVFANGNASSDHRDLSGTRETTQIGASG